MSYLKRFLLAFLFLMSLTANSLAKDLADAPLLKVLTTTNIVNDLVLQIGGDKIQVESLMGAGVDPHYYKATFNDMRKLARADLVFYSGLNLEGRMIDVLENLGATKPTIALADSLSLQDLIVEDETTDPHFWFDIKLWIQAAYGVNFQLGKALPAQKAYFEQRTESYILELEKLHAWAKQQIASIPEQKRLLITAHDAFEYFGKAYGIEVLGLQGINTTSEMGLADLRKVKNIAKERNIQAVFVETTVSDRTIQALIAGSSAEGHQIQLGGHLYSDALGTEKSGHDSYIKMFQHNINTLVKALQ